MERRFARIDVELHGIFGGMGSRERPYWAELDRTVELARRHRVELLGIIRGSPGWLSSCPEQGFEGHLCTPRDPAAFGRLAGEVAAHARSVEHWEILNEPDARWAFKGSAEDYARMLSAARDAIEARAPRAKVVLGGLERPWEERWLRRVLRRPRPGRHTQVRHRRRPPAPPPERGAPRDGRAAAPLARAARGARLPRAGLGYRARLSRRPGLPVGSRRIAVAMPHRPRSCASRSRSWPRRGADQVFVTLRDNLYGEFLSEGHRAHRRGPAGLPDRTAAGVRRGARSRGQLGRADRRQSPPARATSALEAALAQRGAPLGRGGPSSGRGAYSRARRPATR